MPETKEKGRPGGGGESDEANEFYPEATPAATRPRRVFDPILFEIWFGGGRLALWPSTRRRLAGYLRRRPTPIGRLASRRQILFADLSADVRLDALLAAAEAAGLIEIRDGGAVEIISLVEPARPDPDDDPNGRAERPDDVDDDAAGPVSLAPLRWAAGRRR